MWNIVSDIHHHRTGYCSVFDRNSLFSLYNTTMSLRGFPVRFLDRFLGFCAATCTILIPRSFKRINNGYYKLFCGERAEFQKKKKKKTKCFYLRNEIFFHGITYIIPFYVSLHNDHAFHRHALLRDIILFQIIKKQIYTLSHNQITLFTNRTSRRLNN